MLNTPIICICNHKGGVAKTTTVYHLGLSLAARNLFPLLIDLDPQSNLTRLCLGRRDGPTVSDVLGGAAPATASLRQAAQIITLGEAGDLHQGAPAYLVASSLGLENVAVGLLQRNFNRLTALKSAIDTYTQSGIGGTSCILIDTPPNAGILTINALVAATHVIICADPEQDAIDGAKRIVSIVADIKRERGQAPTVLGVLATRVNPVVVRHEQGLAELRKPGMPPLLGTIPQRAGQDAIAKLSAAYADVAIQIWDRIGGDNGNA